MHREQTLLKLAEIINESAFSILRYTHQEKEELQRKEDIASVVYIQTGCNPPSDRDVYVNELRKYISIDCYGQCLHNKDLPPEYR